jgi:hypothetical protein
MLILCYCDNCVVNVFILIWLIKRLGLGLRLKVVKMVKSKLIIIDVKV